MLVSLTVGKVDAGVAVLLTEDKRLIEFPSILLPPDISSGSIVDVNVARNYKAEAAAAKSFRTLQSDILATFGAESPSAPVLRCRNATQTSVVLEWDPIHLATADLRSLSLFRNGNKAGAIPRPLEVTSTKISGLAVDTEYSFHLVLRTSAGTYSSERLTVRTHKMTDLTGITVTPGVMPTQLRGSLEATIERIGARLAETMRIDTTHFICTEGRGAAWEKAMETNVPIVVPDWLKGCEREGRLVGVRGYYLNADPKLRQVGPGVVVQKETRDGPGEHVIPQQQQGRISTRQASEPDIHEAQARERAQMQEPPRTEITPPTPERLRKGQGDTTEDEEEEEESGSEEPRWPPSQPTRPPAAVVSEEASAEEEDDEGDDEDSEAEPSHSTKVQGEPGEAEDSEAAGGAEEEREASKLESTGEGFDEVSLS